MAFKSVQCRADQSSSFGHLRPPPQTSVTTTLNRPPLHNPLPARAVHSALQESCQATALYDTALRVGALDKALDIWYNTGVGLKETHKQEQSNMITIKLKSNDNPERAFTKLKNIVIKEGLYKELKDRRYYAKPSKKKRLKKEEAARQRVKDLHKDIRAALRDEENFLL